MYNVLSKPKPKKIVVYARVATEAQLQSKRSTCQKEKDYRSTIKIGKTLYHLSTELFKPKELYYYSYNLHNLLKLKLNNRM